MMHKRETLKDRVRRMSIRQRLTCSNLLMFLIPVAVTVLTALAAGAVALYALERFYLPRMGLTVRDLHQMGEQYESDVKSFLILLFFLCLVMLGVLVLSIVLTNRFLTRFMFRRVEEPLELLRAGVARINRGEPGRIISYDREDEFAPVFCAFNDMAEQLRISAEQAAAQDQSRRELFAGISHDLRSPLTSVRAYTEALLDGVARTPADTRRYLTKIRVHEAEIERLVEALFLYAKMELKDYPVHLQSLNLRTELLRICGECAPQPTAGQPGEQPDGQPSVLTDLSGVLPLCVRADPFLLERIVCNLVDNSRKYRKGACAHVRFTATPADGGVLLSVADDGIGVPEARLSRLFDPFYRTDPARNRPADGSGLGLAIVREAVGHLGGRVWAENVPDGGLDVRILLPEGKEESTHAAHSDH